VPTQSAAPRPAARVFRRPAAKSVRAAREPGIRPAIFYGCFAALIGTNVLTLVGFLMAPDIAALMNGQNKLVFSAYEDRIAQLRVEVDRLHSRQYAQAGDINLQLQELTQQQEVLLEQHQYVKQLAEKAAELGIVTADLSPAEHQEDPALLTGALSYGPGDGRPGIEAAAAAIDEMMSESRLALAAISEGANTATEDIVTALGGVGIRPKLPAEDAMGGPFEPAVEGADSLSIVDDANAVFGALARFRAARSAMDAAPIHKPVVGNVRMSSGYGNRKDPFTRRKAFHAGIDFPAPSGTTVLSAGAGTVIFAGRKSGYGNVVEISHGDGLVTRYAHLSAFLVKEGQSVSTGTPIARVGSTGRSTGPHLHFEVRRKDGAVDPAGYLAVGKRLRRYLGV
jgi:murein DD-endopeptidase MepM/ murein hydrolase activator NlpD